MSNWPHASVFANVVYEFVPANQEWEARMEPVIVKREHPDATVEHDRREALSYCGDLDGVQEAIRVDLIKFGVEVEELDGFNPYDQSEPGVPGNDDDRYQED